MPYLEILKHVKKKDGSAPSIRAVQNAVYTWATDRKQVGRKEGWRKTTKKDDRTILAKFNELRPPARSRS
jgi:hypothetical protein